jgi:Ca2+-binding EF-hand superfamily protein
VYSGAESVLQIASVVRGRVNLIVDGLKMSLVARGGGANNRMVTRGYLGQEFSLLDADRSQSLDQMEFEGLKLALQRAGADVEFQQIDTDQDLQMTRQELFGYAEREQAAVLSRLEMMVEQSGRTMFSLLDSNSDRRLTRREMLQSGDRLKEYDLNADGAYSDVELGTEYVLTIGLGRSELGRTQGGGQMAGMEMLNAGDAILPGRGGLAGPAWFQLMDRNQDGDVSRREFPGTTEQFSQLDLDQDGLMSVEEAERLESAGDTPAK